MLWHSDAAKGSSLTLPQPPWRTYFKFKSREHKFGDTGRQSHLFNRAVLAAPKGKRSPTIGVAWNLANGDYAYLDYFRSRSLDLRA